MTDNSSPHILGLRGIIPGVPAPGGLLSRPLLIRRIVEGARRPLLLLLAPPGFGKSTAALQAIPELEGVVVWHEVSESAATPGDVVASVYAATGVRENDRLRVVGLGPSAAAQIVATLLREKDVGRSHLIIDGLDRSPNIVALSGFIRSLLSVAPESLHIMVTSTTRPTFSLGTLRRSGDLEVIGEDALRFSVEEMAELLELAWRRRPSTSVVQTVARLTAGWPAGLALFLMAHRAPPTQEELASPALADAIDPPDRLVLYAMAAAPFIALENLEHLAGEGARGRAQELIDRVPGAFRQVGSVTSLAPALRHELWGRAQAELPPATVTALRLRAAEYLKEEGCLESALRLFVQERDVDAINEALSHLGLSWSFRCDPARFSMIAAEMERLPGLCPEGQVICARHRVLNRAFQRASEMITGALAKAQTPAHRAWLLAYQAHLLSLEGAEAADEAWAEAANMIGSMEHVASWPLVLLGSHLVRANRLKEAARVLERVLGFEGPYTEEWDVTWAWALRGELELRRGAYGHALEALDEIDRRGKRLGVQAVMVGTHMRARVAALQGDLGRAIVLGTEAFETAVRFGVPAEAADFAAFLARWMMCEGRHDPARGWLERAERFADTPEVKLTRRSIVVCKALASWLSDSPEAAFGFLSTAHKLPRHDRFESLWDDLLLALVAFRSGHEDLGGRLLEGVLASAAGAQLSHLTANALLLRAFWRLGVGDTMGAQRDIDTAHSMSAACSLEFMPATDAPLIAVLRTACSGKPEVAPWLARLRFPPYQVAPALKPGAPVVIETLGPLELRRGDGQVGSAVWRNHRKSRLLFELLLASQAYRASVDEIIEYLWPDVMREPARHRLECAASSLRRVLKRAFGDDSIQLDFEQPFYRLVLARNVEVSHVMFESEAHAGLREVRCGEEKGGVAKLRRAVAKYRGVFLEDALYERFTDLTRQRLADLYEEVVTCLTDVPSVEPTERTALWEGLLRVDPFNETAYQRLIASAVDRGMHGIAAGYFRAMKRRLCEELQLPIPRWAHALGGFLEGDART